MGTEGAYMPGGHFWDDAGITLRPRASITVLSPGTWHTSVSSKVLRVNTALLAKS
jgi:hypothetical protein